MPLDWLGSQLQGAVAALESACRWLVGAADGKTTYALSRWMFLRALGVIYLIAFVSFWVQVKGLIGPQGVLPAQDFLQALRRHLGPERYRVVPTVLWLDAGGPALDAVCALGVLASLLLIANLAPIANLVLLWVLYLSLASVGRDFLAFQWDVLLLEVGLLAVLVAPTHLLAGRSFETGVSAVALFLLWWLLFRLMFQSGVVKLTSGDPTWRDLTALDYHYWTQPLPTWAAWFVNLTPAWFKKLSVLLTFAIEIGFPLLIFGPRPVRLAACAGLVFLQLLIFATGNYNFFNLLAFALLALLVDDALWARILPARLVDSLPAQAGTGPPGLWAAAAAVAGLALFLLATAKLWLTFPGTSLPRFAARAIAWTEPFRSVNSYGLFRVMTTQRPEIVIEGSEDGSTWLAYEFKYKPGDVFRRPAFVEPHQPRLDWQMWFAALSHYELTPWFQAFLARLLEGSPPVLGLLERNPFPGRPPRYVRALLYEYRFTSWGERRATGAWWTRRLMGRYSPVVTLPSPP